MKKPKCIIFDCDGVLVDSEILVSRVEVEVKNQLGFPISLEEQITKFVGCGMKHPAMIAEIQRLPPDFIRMVDERCDEVYAKELRAIPGVRETLQALNIPICVASSSDAHYLDMKLNLTDLKIFFENAIFHGSLVEKQKPEPDLFLYALEKLGWKADECLVVEDSEPGVKAGKAAGMKVCGFLGGAHIYPGHADRLLKAGADYLISDMRNLPALL